MQIADQESEEDRRDQAAKSVFLFVSFFFSSFFYNYGNRALVKEIELRPPNSLSIAP